jgi:alpha-galactosidase
MAKPNTTNRILKVKGLDDKKIYRIEGTDVEALGATIRKVGLVMPSLNGDFRSELIYLVAKD